MAAMFWYYLLKVSEPRVFLKFLSTIVVIQSLILLKWFDWRWASVFALFDLSVFSIWTVGVIVTLLIRLKAKEVPAEPEKPVMTPPPQPLNPQEDMAEWLHPYKNCAIILSPNQTQSYLIPNVFSKIQTSQAIPPEAVQVIQKTVAGILNKGVKVSILHPSQVNAKSYVPFLDSEGAAAIANELKLPLFFIGLN
ncbi:MAG: hypothetical protein AB7F28_04460 [Candidatus Margulisiibacteriota bacterium]